MKRRISGLLAGICALFAVWTASLPSQRVRAPWVVFGGAVMEDNGDLAGRFQVLDDPAGFDGTFPAELSQRIRIGNPLVMGLPWIVDGIDSHVRHRCFYEMRAVQRPLGSSSPVWDMTMMVKESESECVRLRHRVTGHVFRIMTLEKIYGRNQRAFTFPDTPATGRWVGLPRHLSLPFVEEREPPKPLRHEAGTGPLALLKSRTGVIGEYFECADGRLVYWDQVNRKLVVRMKPTQGTEW